MDYGRLFAMYTLEGARDEAGFSAQSELDLSKEDGGKRGHSGIVAMPSERSASESEKLLWERFQDYKYIVVHHKVHLYDEIVENILVRMLASGALNKFLAENINYLLGDGAASAGDSVHNAKKYLNALQQVLLEFDDPWIEGRIREVYMKSLLNGEQSDGSSVLFRVYVEERDSLSSAFKSDAEFWKAVQLDAPLFAALYPRPIGRKEEAADHTESLRDYVSKALYASKFALQKKLSEEFKCTVIVGPTDRKVNYGVKNDDEARLFHLGELVTFLKLKKYGTRLFNLWWEKNSYSRPDFIPRALKIVEKFIADEMRATVKRQK